MRKLVVISLVMFLGLITPLIADEANPEAEKNSTLEQVDKKIDKDYSAQQIIYKEIRNNPLESKTFGIEFNFVRAIILTEHLSLTGGISFFNIDRDAEIAFPFYYSKPNDPKGVRIFTIDCHYRYFLGLTQNGFYISALTRLANFSGPTDEINSSDESYSKDSMTEFGIGIGIGYRIFSYKRVYWGTSISVGKYLLSKDINTFNFTNIDGNENSNNKFFTFELLKFGFAF